jgi:hypothetical protein
LKEDNQFVATPLYQALGQDGHIKNNIHQK